MPEKVRTTVGFLIGELSHYPDYMEVAVAFGPGVDYTPVSVYPSDDNTHVWIDIEPSEED